MSVYKHSSVCALCVIFEVISVQCGTLFGCPLLLFSDVFCLTWEVEALMNVLILYIACETLHSREWGCLKVKI